MRALALSFDEDASARQPYLLRRGWAAASPPSSNSNDNCVTAETSPATPVEDRAYVYLGNLPVAQVDGATGEVFYIHADHLGTPQAVTDALGQLAWEDAYQPFGTATNTGAATAVAMDLRFPGQRLDAETGYHYNYFRDYDPTLGRYLQSDPIGLAGGLNTYGYVGGNPVRYVDPMGEVALEATMAWVGTDTAIPDPTDVAWPKWVAYAAAIGGAAALDYILLNENVDSQNDEAEKCETPDTHPENFENVKGSKAKTNKKTGEVLEKDLLHKDHWEVYKNKKMWEKGRRKKSVWPDGKTKQLF